MLFDTQISSLREEAPKDCKQKRSPVNAQKTFTGLLGSLFIHETQYHYRIQILFTATRVKGYSIDQLCTVLNKQIRF